MDLATIERLDAQGWKVDTLYLDTRHGTFAVHARFPTEVTATRAYSQGGKVDVESLVSHTDALTVEGALARVRQRIAQLDTVACANDVAAADARCAP